MIFFAVESGSMLRCVEAEDAEAAAIKAVQMEVIEFMNLGRFRKSLDVSPSDRKCGEGGSAPR